jgi:hypothetical protein
LEQTELAFWLLRQGNPVIRFRTLVDFLNEQDVGMVSEALDSVLKDDEVKLCLDRLVPEFDLDQVHSSKDTAFENVMGKLVQLGMRAGLQPFDNKTLPHRVWLSENNEAEPVEPHFMFKKSVLASFLSYAGYGSTKPVRDHLFTRLNGMNQFAINPSFETIFVDKSEFSGIPKATQEHDLVNPELYPNQNFRLPWIYDIRGLAFCQNILENPTLKERCERVVSLILTEEYQNLPRSYGIAKYGEKYYVLGWAVHLPGYKNGFENLMSGELLLTLEMMSSFDSAKQSEWFQNAIKYLETFRTDTGTYLFPRELLTDKKDGYWISGLRMGLESNRTTQSSLEIESTFWMVHIKRLAGLL